MDIISFSQSKKAQKEVLKLQKDVGNTATTKHESEDVKGTFENVDKRLEDIEFKLSPGETNKMISDATKKTMINLMKQQFKVDAIMQSRKESLENMVFDSFLNADGIDQTASKNIMYDNKGFIKQTNNSIVGQVIMKNVKIKGPINQIRVSLNYNEVLTESTKVDKVNAKYDPSKIVFNGADFKLDMTEQIAKEAEVESDVIDLGLDYKNINEIKVICNEQDESKIKLFLSESNDGNIFEPYYEVNKNVIKEIKTKRYIKIKAILVSGYHLKSDMDIFRNNESRFHSTSKNIDLSNSIMLLNEQKKVMTPLEPSNNESNINTITINRNEFKTIESVSIE